MLTIVLAVPSASIAPLTVRFILAAESVRPRIIELLALEDTAALDAPEAALATAALEMSGILIGGGVAIVTVEVGTLEPSTPEMLVEAPPVCDPENETGFRSGKPRLTAL